MTDREFNEAVAEARRRDRVDFAAPDPDSTHDRYGVQHEEQS